MASQLLSTSDLNEIGKTVELALESKMKIFFGLRRKRRDVTRNTFTMARIDLTYLVMTWNNYNQYKENQIAQLASNNDDIEIPEIFEYLEECTTCSVLPTIELEPGLFLNNVSISTPTLSELSRDFERL